jgi:hypothetical protein
VLRAFVNFDRREKRTGNERTGDATTRSKKKTARGDFREATEYGKTKTSVGMEGNEVLGTKR